MVPPPKGVRKQSMKQQQQTSPKSVAVIAISTGMDEQASMALPYDDDGTRCRLVSMTGQVVLAAKDQWAYSTCRDPPGRRREWSDSEEEQEWDAAAISWKTEEEDIESPSLSSSSSSVADFNLPTDCSLCTEQEASSSSFGASQRSILQDHLQAGGVLDLSEHVQQERRPKPPKQGSLRVDHQGASSPADIETPTSDSQHQQERLQKKEPSTKFGESRTVHVIWTTAVLLLFVAAMVGVSLALFHVLT